MNRLSDLFDDICLKRMGEGAEVYGELGFLKNDMFKMLAEELFDVANYAKMHFIKLALIAEGMPEGFNETVQQKLGREGFIPAGGASE